MEFSVSLMSSPQLKYAQAVFTGCRVRLSYDVSDVVRARVGNRELVRVASHWDFPDDSSTGIPEMYTEKDGDIFLWPAASRPMPGMLYWTGNGGAGRRARSLNDSLPAAFTDLYRAEYHRAKAAS